jgi:phosphate starvation-inducible PhoH-like protein
VTIRNAISILDEAQNCTYKQLKLFLTRIGFNGKLIINGDLSQIDLLPGQSGLEEIMNRLKDVPQIGTMNFSESAIVRHPIIKSIIEKI